MPGLLPEVMRLPIILFMIVQTFYNIVNSFFVINMTSDRTPNMGNAAVNTLLSKSLGDYNRQNNWAAE